MRFDPRIESKDLPSLRNSPCPASSNFLASGLCFLGLARFAGFLLCRHLMNPPDGSTSHKKNYFFFFFLTAFFATFFAGFFTAFFFVFFPHFAHDIGIFPPIALIDASSPSSTCYRQVLLNFHDASLNM